ncbi:MAG: AmmeMemoRadiSam system protein B [Anaerolineae bacterium]|nr:AmmeMemoRadiSam system protein B [Anaerolineae bacterium]
MRLCKLGILILVLGLCACRSQSIPSPTAATSTPSSKTPLAPPTSAPANWIHPANFAGSWYPADPTTLSNEIDRWLAANDPVDGAPIGLIVPHAGYVYSGAVAAEGFRQLRQGDYQLAVIIAADHQAPLSQPIAIWPKGGFETPLGMVAVDEATAQALIETSSLIHADPAAFQGEHPIELELPFLQRTCPQCRIVPILMGDKNPETIEALSNALSQVLAGKKAVIIASSDLAHYPPYSQALVIDRATLFAIETGDPLYLQQTTKRLMSVGFTNLVTCACGEGPILVTMRAAKALGANTTTLLRYANSGETPYGKRDQVVGYGAVMLWHYAPPELTNSRRQALLALARKAIEDYLEGEKASLTSDDPVLNRRAGVFVTLKEGQALRGCIGRLRADLPLYQAVQEMAIAAATADPRFPPLKKSELKDLRIEISVLSPLRPVTDTKSIRIGTHGLLIIQGQRRGVLLPQVAQEEGWSRKEFLENLCYKAGLEGDCWHKEGSLLYSFQAIVFGEDLSHQ